MNALKQVKTYTDNYTSLATIQDGYTKHFNTFLDWLQDNGLSNLTMADQLRAYFKDLQESNYKPRTVTIKRQAVKNRLRRMADTLDIQERYFFETLLKRIDKDIPAPKQASLKIQHSKLVTATEYKTILERCRSEKQRLFLTFLWATGSRIAELTGIKITDTEKQGEAYSLTLRGKGNKYRQVLIQAELYERIQAEFNGQCYLFETAGGKAYETSYISNQIRKIAKTAINRKVSAHSLRHGFATDMIKRTGKVKAVSEYLGHASVKTTLDFYVHEELSNDEIFNR